MGVKLSRVENTLKTEKYFGSIAKLSSGSIRWRNKNSCINSSHSYWLGLLFIGHELEAIYEKLKYFVVGA